MYTVNQSQIQEKISDMNNFSGFCTAIKEMNLHQFTSEDILQIYAILHVLYDNECEKEDYEKAYQFMQMIVWCENAISVSDWHEMTTMAQYYKDCYQEMVVIVQ